MKKMGSNSWRRKIPISGERSLFIIAFLWYLHLLLYTLNLLALCSTCPAPLKYCLRMTFTFENDKNTIIYALEKIITFTRDNPYVFVAQCVWWLASIIGLESGLVAHVENDRIRSEIVHSPTHTMRRVSKTPEKNKLGRQDKILTEWEKFLQESKRLRGIAQFKSSGRTINDHVNPHKFTKKILWRKIKSKDFSKTEWIKESEIQRRKAAGECLRCAWPPGDKWIHMVKDSIRLIKLDKGTAKNRMLFWVEGS